ncbi:hypothetical protein QFZ51_004665 [Chitinophaga sp. W3I9]|uniref:hypothetical protein n=1 Tax=Chitinophaga sp. W3I9 TaxID=3373924 RepID=UPI003D1F6A13
MTLQIEIVEKQLVTILKDYCERLEIPEKVDSDFFPGNFIKSQVLLTAICEVELALEVVIPNECYIFCEKRRQLSVKEVAQKILEIAKVEM